MKNEKSDAGEGDSSSFDTLPDEVVLQIFRKIIDFESLCPCRLVSKRFYRITLQVDTIRFITKPSISYKSFLSAIRSLKKFEGLKSLKLCASKYSHCIKNVPLLEKVTLTDSRKRCRISLNKEKIAEMRSGLSTPYELIRRNRVSKCYVPLLELPVSGYVLKGVTVFLMERDDLPIGNDSFMKIDDDDSEDKLEAAFNEALMEIFKKHAARFEMQHGFTSVAFL
ncbi:F-box domain containing protein [Tanacetum coccineum]